VQESPVTCDDANQLTIEIHPRSRPGTCPDALRRALCRVVHRGDITPSMIGDWGARGLWTRKFDSCASILLGISGITYLWERSYTFRASLERLRIPSLGHGLCRHCPPLHLTCNIPSYYTKTSASCPVFPTFVPIRALNPGLDTLTDFLATQGPQETQKVVFVLPPEAAIKRTLDASPHEEQATAN
jgi:hypothetical protein